MKAIKLMMSGGLLILLGPLMAVIDVMFSGMMVLCWLVGIPLFIGGLLTREGKSVPPMQEELPQKKCPKCGKMHDFDYPRCPYCGHGE